MILKDSANGPKIHKYIRRKMHIFFYCMLFAVGCILYEAVKADLYVDCKVALYSYIARVLKWFGEQWYEAGRNMKCVVSENIAEFYNILITILTILSAIVIFFYSVQDNRKEGIPYRTILAYTVGSFTIPVFFFLSMLILPVSFWFYHFDMKISFVVCTFFSYCFQILIIGLILFSISLTFGQRVICNTEIRQYQKLCKIKKKSSRNPENNPQFVWTYLMHHLEQAVTSDELIADKMMLVRELLKTPYHDKKRILAKIQKKKYESGMSKERLENNDLGGIYEFYYLNLSAAMEYLSSAEHRAERDKIYWVLYEFLDDLQKLYGKVDDVVNDLKKKKARKNYMMTVAGLMNAVLESEVPDAEGFCNHILNECIQDEEVRLKQIGLYFLYQEYLYRTRIEEKDDDKIIPIEYIKCINGVRGWRMHPEDERVYYIFWQIWMEWTTVSEKNRIAYFSNAIAAMSGKKYYPGLISHIMLSINRCGDKYR